MKTYFGLMMAALGVAVLSGGALLWDGSYYLYAALDRQVPFIPHHRYIAALLQAPVLAANYVTHNTQILYLIFGLTYALVPLLSLGLSWLIVRRTAPALFVWAALGFGFGTLMLQLHFVAEAMISVQLMWPVLLAVMTEPRGWTRVVVVCLSLLAFVSHPFALALFAVAAAMAVVVGIRYHGERLEKWLWAAWFVLLAVAGAWLFAGWQTNYEAEQMSVPILLLHYQQALQGVPTLAFAAVAVAMALLFATPYLQDWQKRLQLRWAWANLTALAFGGELASLLAAGVLFALWASVPRLWADARNYRTWLLFFSLPFVGLAGLESLLSRTDSGQGPERQWQHRMRTVQVVGLVFAAVIGLQSLSWISVTNQLRDAMAQNRDACISISSLSNVPHTALEHWSLTPYSLILQGSTPGKIVLNGNCDKTDFGKGLPIAAWDLRQWTGGEFDMHLLRQYLVAAS